MGAEELQGTGPEVEARAGCHAASFVGLLRWLASNMSVGVLESVVPLGWIGIRDCQGDKALRKNLRQQATLLTMCLRKSLSFAKELRALMFDRRAP